jgi:hypothetical protein
LNSLRLAKFARASAFNFQYNTATLQPLVITVWGTSTQGHSTLNFDCAHDQRCEVGRSNLELRKPPPKLMQDVNIKKVHIVSVHVPDFFQRLGLCFDVADDEILEIEK